MLLWLFLQALGIAVVLSSESRCTKCMEMREQAARTRTDMIKTTILKKLDLKQPPRIELSPKLKPTVERIKREVENEAQNINLNAEADESKTKVETIVFGEDSVFRHRNVVQFRLSKDLRAKEVVSASLKINPPFNLFNITEYTVQELQQNGTVTFYAFAFTYSVFFTQLLV
uniref:Selenoprotein H n=1 Tax=Syphacia muris TaxID=451379 RepID=A0A0N5AZP8_9BILA